MGKGAAVPWARGAKRGGWVKRGCPPPPAVVSYLPFSPQVCSAYLRSSLDLRIYADRCPSSGL
jgi:hypothetical protein